MRPLLLVHGISSNARHTYGTPGRFFKQPKKDSMFTYLLDLGYQPGKNLFWYSYPTFQPIFHSSRRLKQEIKKARESSGSPAVDIVAFSLGCIISKYYLISPWYQGEINKLCMIAPPFLGSPRADICKTYFTREEGDFLFPGDSRALSPQILGTNHPLLSELARQPFPQEVDTAIIAMKIEQGPKKNLLATYQNLIDAWIGEGDHTVPVKSTRIPVNRHYVVVEKYSPKVVHGFVPNHPQVKAIVGKELTNKIQV